MSTYKKTDQEKAIEKESERGTKAGETRATFIVDKILLGKLKEIAHMEGAKIKEVVEEALSHLVNRYEEANGKIIGIVESLGKGSPWMSIEDMKIEIQLDQDRNNFYTRGMKGISLAFETYKAVWFGVLEEDPYYPTAIKSFYTTMKPVRRILKDEPYLINPRGWGVRGTPLRLPSSEDWKIYHKLKE